MIKKSLFALLPIAILAIGWYLIQNKNTTPDSFSNNNFSNNTASTAGNNTTPADRTSQPASTENPLKPEKDDASLIVDSVNDSTDSQTDKELIVDSEPTTAASEIETSSIAVEPLSDAEFIRLERLLKHDKTLRLSLLEEFRNNTDPARAKQLAALLGPYDDPEILQVASELAYSGDTQSRIAGLDLLSRIQPRNDTARDIAIDLLNAGDSADVLVATMNVLAIWKII